MNSRRDSLNKIKVDNVAHAGLWLDCYLPSQSTQSTDAGKSSSALTQHFADVANIARKEPVLNLYRAFFTRWVNTLKEIPEICLLRAEVEGRMVVGLGAESVLENSIALQRTYGLPYIPGSGLKGLASSFAHQRLGQGIPEDGAKPKWSKGGEFHRELFGTTELSGCVSFYDALYIPGTAQADGPLHSDVITVHHPKYYQGNSTPPADWDSPDIIPFLSATGHYLVALSGDPNWCNAARTLLANGLTHLGIGAKTSSGYGRMKVNPNCLTNEQIESLLKSLK
jgi:CRISPR-associated protein Cmr6